MQLRSKHHKPAARHGSTASHLNSDRQHVAEVVQQIGALGHAHASLLRSPDAAAHAPGTTPFVAHVCVCVFSLRSAHAIGTRAITSTDQRRGDCSKGCEEEGVVKRVHTLLGGVHRLATALNVVEEVQEEVQEKKDEWEDEEVEGNGGLKVEGEPHTSCVDEMTCATPLSHAVQCVNHDDKNLTNKQENCALTCQCSCALC